MKTILLALAILAAVTARASDVGNGAGSVQCDGVGGTKKFQLVDLVEASRAGYGGQFSNEEVFIQIARAVEKAKQYNSKFGSELETAVAHARSVARASQVPIYPPSDAGIPYLMKDCHLAKGVGLFKDYKENSEIDPSDELQVDYAALGEMDYTNQAAFWVHEAVYKLLRIKAHRPASAFYYPPVLATSIPARRIVGALFAKETQGVELQLPTKPRPGFEVKCVSPDYSISIIRGEDDVPYAVVTETIQDGRRIQTLLKEYVPLIVGRSWLGVPPPMSGSAVIKELRSNFVGAAVGANSLDMLPEDSAIEFWSDRHNYSLTTNLILKDEGSGKFTNLKIPCNGTLFTLYPEVAPTQEALDDLTFEAMASTFLGLSTPAKLSTLSDTKSGYCTYFGYNESKEDRYSSALRIGKEKDFISGYDYSWIVDGTTRSIGGKDFLRRFDFYDTIYNDSFGRVSAYDFPPLKFSPPLFGAAVVNDTLMFRVPDATPFSNAWALRGDSKKTILVVGKAAKIQFLVDNNRFEHNGFDDGASIYSNILICIYYKDAVTKPTWRP